jgi:alkaline phosphatase D
MNKAPLISTLSTLALLACETSSPERPDGVAEAEAARAAAERVEARDAALGRARGGLHAALDAITPAPILRPPLDASGPAITHGVAAGEVRQGDAVLWARASAPSTLRFVARPRDGLTHVTAAFPTDAARDFTGSVKLEGLTPGTEYVYEVWAQTDAARGPSARGSFSTAPAPDQPRALGFVWSGDLGGQNVCRGVEDGYPILAEFPQELDFFIALGDMIYSDNTCREKGRYGRAQLPGLQSKAKALEEFWFAWRYNRADGAHQRLLARAPYYPIWDDHEIVNDYGPRHNRRDKKPHATNQELFPVGFTSWLHYNAYLPAQPDPRRLYRSWRWGKHAEFFALDTRQYRDENTRADSKSDPKTMLGAEQRAWFVDALKNSDATWKFVVSSVPMVTPTGTYPETNGRDGWSNHGFRTGFERELVSIMRELAAADVRNQIWLTTDVHFAAIHRLDPFPEDHPDYQVHELIAGPLSAYLFPNKTTDPTLKPTQLWFHGPRNGRDVKDWDAAKHWMNFGAVDIADDGALTVRYVDGHGEVIHTMALAPR